jgi:tRNA-2-methylthio-N6-dimethylallyladenosine synthase
MNERDTEAVSVLLEERGYAPAGGEADARIVLVNTCSVRGKAEDKAIGKLRLLVAGRKRAPGRVVGAIGCMVQRLGAGMFREAPGLDLAVGPRSLAHLPDAVEAALEGRTRLLETGGENRDAASLCGHRHGAVSAFVNVLLGCNRRCAYCVVPEVRGREWSRPGAEVVQEARDLVAHGCREVTLLGQSVMSYGRRNDPWGSVGALPGGFREPFPRLLDAVSRIEGLCRIRFTSGHPSGCTAELARVFAELRPVCEHLHLPVQSGSDRILKRMRRGYTADRYRRAAGRLRAACPALALTTDVIVGFPGESDEDFEATRRFLEEMAFDNAFIFKYSPRPRTVAAGWEDNVPPEEKARRNQVLLADQNRRGQALNERLVGRTVEALVEGPSLRNAARWSGRTRTNKIVVFEPASGIAAGDLIGVTVERATPQTLYGRVGQRT